MSLAKRVAKKVDEVELEGMQDYETLTKKSFLPKVCLSLRNRRNVTKQRGKRLVSCEL